MRRIESVGPPRDARSERHRHLPDLMGSTMLAERSMNREPSGASLNCVRVASGTKSRRPFFDAACPVGGEREPTCDGGGRRKRLLVAPHRIVRCAVANRNREIAGVTLVRASVVCSVRRSTAISTSSRGMYCTAGSDASLSVSARVVSASKRPANVTRTLLGFGAIVIRWSGPGNRISEVACRQPHTTMPI
jgi:hypothetical protein